MKRQIIKWVSIVLIALFTLSGCVTTNGVGTMDNESTLVASYEQGERYKIGGVNVTVLEGTYYDMGCQYGTLLKDEINFMYRSTIEDSIIKGGVASFERLKEEVVDVSWSGLPHSQRELLRGISEASGLELDKVILLDQSMTAAVLHVSEAFGPEGFGACSCLATWGDYTKDGQTVVGRNFDWLNLFQRCSSAFGVVVFKPNDGSVETAIIGYAGWINAMSGINQKGLFLETNSGLKSAGLKVLSDRIPYMNELLSTLLESEDLKFLSNGLTTIRPNMGMLVNISDSKMGLCYENDCHETKLREADSPGLLVTTNEFRLESWGKPISESESHSVRRWDNLNVLAEENKGKIDADVMMKIMDEPLHLGNGEFGKGATKPTIEPNDIDVTVHQIVAVPGERKIWLKVPGAIDWTLVDLNYFFSE